MFSINLTCNFFTSIPVKGYIIQILEYYYYYLLLFVYFMIMHNTIRINLHSLDMK